MSSILSDLNPEQKRAVTHGNGPLLILAGAGSGKTRALTHRAAYLIREKGICPESILLLTFTNKAAGEMKSRISQLLSNQQSAISNQNVPYAGTFHSFCARVLRKDGGYLGIPPNYTIFDEDDQLEAIKDVLKKLGYSPKDSKPSLILNLISQAKNEMISELEYPQYARGEIQKLTGMVYLEYQSLLRKNDAVDFDDLLNKTVNLFNKFPEVGGKYQNQYEYVLVDEYQDTNQAQYQLTKILVKRHRNLTCVGDASQSIYSWRGANYRNLVNLKSDFNDLTIINLEQNYRSHQTILDAAFKVISRNTTHPILKLWTDRGCGEKIKIFEAENEVAEAEFLANEVQSLATRHLSLEYKNIAVLYRTNAQSRVIEEALIRNGIPYLLVGGTRFYQRKEIKDVISYLRLVANPNDSISLKRIEKLGKNRMGRFMEWSAASNAVSAEDKAVSRQTRLTLDIIDQVLKVTDYLSLYDEKVPEDLARLENIKELFSVAAEYPILDEFLENVALVEQEYLKKSKSDRNAVTLMTLHAAKGLEFGTVFMVGMEEGLFPHSRALESRDEMEEERRLCYVGITRSKNNLYLTSCRRRLYFGQRSMNLPSRFLEDIPPELSEVVYKF